MGWFRAALRNAPQPTLAIDHTMSNKLKNVPNGQAQPITPKA